MTSAWDELTTLPPWHDQLHRLAGITMSGRWLCSCGGVGKSSSMSDEDATRKWHKHMARVLADSKTVNKKLSKLPNRIPAPYRLTRYPHGGFSVRPRKPTARTAET